jgi:hypothetical protein
VVVTVNGKPDAVLTDVETYERKLKAPAVSLLAEERKTRGVAPVRRRGLEEWRRARRYRVEIARAAERDSGSTTTSSETPQQRAVKWFLEIERQFGPARSPKRCPVIRELEIGRIPPPDYGSYRTIFRIEGEAVYVLRVVMRAAFDTSALE